MPIQTQEAVMPSRTGGHIHIPAAFKQFAMVPGVVLEDTSLSFGARLLYGVLIWLAWRQKHRRRGYEGQDALADEFGSSPRSVRRYMGELQERGYIVIERVGQGEPDDITLVPLDDLPAGSSNSDA